MKPNFFIVGASKAGTTALSEYLRQHPDIFVSYPKEIHYFALDFPRYRYVESLDDYIAIFAAARCRAVGEASVYYIYSSVALQEIHRFNPQARIIVMLRHPVELACAQHSEMLFNCNEDVEDFLEAWNLQEARKQGMHIPPGCRDPKVLFYRDIALLGAQVERLLDIFPREQVLFVWTEDLRMDAGRVYREVLAFLGVPDDGRNRFGQVNVNKRFRYRWLARWSQTPPAPVVRTARWLRLRMGVNLGWLLRAVRGWNKVTAERMPLPADAEACLRASFAEDIRKLAALTGRNLDHWLNSDDVMAR